VTSEIDSYLEQQYNNRLAVPDCADFLADWTQRSAKLPREIKRSFKPEIWQI
jgi:hypothetical protein